jgi:hypothetical protein
MHKFKVRFHLGQGEHFQHWQVSQGGTTYYLDPNRVSLTMVGCKLRNHPATAQKIHDGAHKKVCAWIDCEELEVTEPDSHVGLPISYNPRVAPHWRNIGGRNIDGMDCPVLRTNGRQVVYTGERSEVVNGRLTVASPILTNDEGRMARMRSEA